MTESGFFFPAFFSRQGKVDIVLLHWGRAIHSCFRPGERTSTKKEVGRHSNDTGNDIDLGVCVCVGGGNSY